MRPATQFGVHGDEHSGCDFLRQDLRDVFARCRQKVMRFVDQ